MKNDELVQKLQDSLQRLTALLRLDPECQWTSKFESAIAVCQKLKVNGCSQSDLGALSNSITYVYQGMGSFNDYAPTTYDRKSGRCSPIPGTEDYESVAAEVFERAKSLIRFHS
jgi:hypothetical protein